MSVCNFYYVLKSWKGINIRSLSSGLMLVEKNVTQWKLKIIWIHIFIVFLISCMMVSKLFRNLHNKLPCWIRDMNQAPDRCCVEWDACGVRHLLVRRSLDGKWKVLCCAHALPGINIKAQKWRYTAPSCTPVRQPHRRFLYSNFTPT